MSRPRRSSSPVVQPLRIMTQLALFGLILAIGLTSAIAVAAESPKLDSTLHARVLERAQELPRLRSLLISIDGALVEERYFNGMRPSHTANIKSASKSVLSTLVGIALDRGHLKSVQESIVKFFPEHLTGGD